MRPKLILALVVVVVLVAVSALAVLRPWERQGEGQTGGENEQQEQTLKLFSRPTALTLEETGDNLPIENVLVYAPFPDEFENLYFRSFSLATENQGFLIVHFDNNGVENVIVNTLTGRSRPVFIIEDTQAGKRAAMRIDALYPGDILNWAWRFWAPESTSLYDGPENACNVYVNYSPVQKTIKLELNASLLYLENYAQINENNYGIVWWEWQRDIDSQGWIDAPSEI